MTDDTSSPEKPEPFIRLRDTAVDLPGGPWTATSECSTARDKRQHHGYLVKLDPGDMEVWFWITIGDRRWMKESTPTPEERGTRVLDALGKWLRENPEHHWKSRNDFRVSVADDGPRVDLYTPDL